MAFQKQETTAYIKKQTAKGAAAAVAAGDAVEVTAASGLVKPESNPVERTVLRPGKRLGAKKAIVGRWGMGDLGVEWHGSGTAGTAPEFGAALKTLLGAEHTNAAGTVEALSGAVDGFDSTLDLAVGSAVRVEIGSAYEIRLIATKSGAGPYSYTVDRNFSEAPADSAVIAAGVSYIVDNAPAALPWLTVEQYEDAAKYLATDARCRSLSLTIAAREIIEATLGFKALSCQESDAADALTPSWDGQNPLTGTNLTFLMAGASLRAKQLELSVEVPKEDSYFNDNGLSDLPGDATINATGSFQPEMEDTSPLTSFFNGTLADMIASFGTAAGNLAYIQLQDIQYEKPDVNEEEGDLIWNVPYTVTGGICLAFF